MRSSKNLETLSSLVSDYFKRALERIDRTELEETIRSGRLITPVIEQQIRELGTDILRFFGKLFWRDIESWLLDVDRVKRKLLECRPDLKDLLESEEGNKWLCDNLQHIYDRLYSLIWGD